MTSENQWVSSSLAYIAPTTTGDDAWAQETAARESVGTQRLVHAGIISAPSPVATALRLDADSPHAVVRQRLILLDGSPVELADTYYPRRIAQGTPLQEMRKIRGGAVTLLAELGHVTARVEEDVTARLPSIAEAEALAMPTAEPVIVLERTSFDADDTPIQVDVMVAPARLRRLRYELKVT